MLENGKPGIRNGQQNRKTEVEVKKMAKNEKPKIPTPPAYMYV